MNRPFLALSVLPLLLAACGQQETASIGGLPPLPTGIKVSFPAAPTATYLTLSTDGDEIGGGEVLLQKSVTAGSTSYEPNINDWTGFSSRATALTLPGGETTKAKLLFLKWGMYQDKNGNAKPDEGEWLDVMTHDRVAYASEPVKATFTANGIQHTWDLSTGWNRAEHYVYRPLSGDVYIRSLTSSALWQFTLHTLTPVTSM